MITSFRARHIPVLFGPGAVAQTGAGVRERGIKRALCLFGRNVKASGIARRVIDSLEAAGVEVVAYDGVTADTPDRMVNEAAALGRAEKVEAVVGIGGGSSLDAAKAVNVLMGNEPPINRYLGPGQSHRPGLPLFLIPTTAGTGSEVTSVAVVTDTATNAKRGVIGPATEATLAIVDPELTLGLSPEITALTGMDAFAHAVEACTSVRRNPMSDILAEKAINLIMANLPQALDDGWNLQVRYHLSFAALIAGAAFAESAVHLGHSLAHTLGAVYHISHGLGCAAVLPTVVQYVAEAVPDGVRLVGRSMGLGLADDLPPAELGAAVARAIGDFSRKVKVPHLKEVIGEKTLESAEIERMVGLVLSDVCTTRSPRIPSPAEVESLLRAAHH
ncbi:MAG: iron-containing alcohol dehydrogenase [Moorellales bacterium]